MFKWLGDLGNKFAVSITKALTGFYNEIIDPISDFIEETFEKLKDKIKKMLVNFITDTLVGIEGDYKTLLNDIVSYIEKIPDLPPEIKDLISNIKNPQHQVTALIGNTVMAGVVGSTVEGLFGTLLEPVTQRIRSWLQPNPLDLSTIITAHFRGILTKDDVYYWGSLLGYKKELLSLITETYRPLLSPDTYISSWLRGYIDDAILESKLKENGFDEFQISLVKKLAFYYPPISDLIRFAVREVFSPEIAQKYGQYEDYPPNFDEIVKKAGLSPEYAKWYWASHWELPSISMGVEMFHRGIITYDELKTLLRTLDIMPYWRDKIIQMTYEVPARVDIRRIYQLGIRNKEWVYQQYKKLGYSDEDAQALTEFAIRGASEEERDLTKAEVISGFKEGLLTEDETKTFLKNMGYDDSEVNFYITKAKHDLQKETLNDDLEVIKTKFQKGVIDENGVVTELNKLNLTSKQIDYYLTKWQKVKDTKVIYPSKKDLESFYIYGYITLDDYKEGLRNLGYPEKWVNLYTQYLLDSLKSQQGE
jgi:hypothetical protein